MNIFLLYILYYYTTSFKQYLYYIILCKGIFHAIRCEKVQKSKGKVKDWHEASLLAEHVKKLKIANELTQADVAE